MKLGTRTKVVGWLVAAGLLLAACSPAMPQVVAEVPPTKDPAVAVAATAAQAEKDAQAIETQVAAGIAATQAAQPTATHTALPEPTATDVPPSATPRPTNTPKPTATEAPPTATKPAVTATKAAVVATQGAAATRPPATVAATEPPAVNNNIYSYVDGPAGYYTDIYCYRGAIECTSVMTPGDINFNLYLSSDYDAPWGGFNPYGLAVSRNGVNVPDMFMFVDAGWLQPGGAVGFGASRNFTEPGTYVIRSSGCYTTSEDVACGWSNFAGWIVTFVIQP